MTKLKLSRLPKSGTVRLHVAISETLKEELDQYAAEYSALYEPADAATLIPHMLETFIRSDRGYRSRKARSASRQHRGQVNPAPADNPGSSSTVGDNAAGRALMDKGTEPRTEGEVCGADAVSLCRDAVVPGGLCLFHLSSLGLFCRPAASRHTLASDRARQTQEASESRIVVVRRPDRAEWQFLLAACNGSEHHLWI